MGKGFIIAIAIALFVYFAWKYFGKPLAKFLADEAEGKLTKVVESDAESESLNRAIVDLKEKAARLRNTDKEVKVTSMLREIEKQIEEKENQLKELNK